VFGRLLSHGMLETSRISGAPRSGIATHRRRDTPWHHHRTITQPDPVAAPRGGATTTL